MTNKEQYEISSVGRGEFATHIRYRQDDFKKLQTYMVMGEQCAKS